MIARGRRSEAARILIVVVLTALPLLAWRYGYYGYPLPNTYYAKVSGPLLDRLSRAAGQLWNIALHEGLLVDLLMIAGVPLLILIRSGSRVRRAASLIPFEAILTSGLLAFWFYVGGDHLGDRFLLCLFPLGSYLWLSTIHVNSRPVIASLVLLVCAWQLVPLAVDDRFDYGGPKYDLWITLGDFLKIQRPNDTLLRSMARRRSPICPG